jgi:hypothetical protein
MSCQVRDYTILGGAKRCATGILLRYHNKTSEHLLRMSILQLRYVAAPQNCTCSQRRKFNENGLTRSHTSTGRARGRRYRNNQACRVVDRFQGASNYCFKLPFNDGFCVFQSRATLSVRDLRRAIKREPSRILLLGVVVLLNEETELEVRGTRDDKYHVQFENGTRKPPS